MASGFSSGILDFKAGVVRSDHRVVPSVGLQLLGNDAPHTYYAVNPQTNVRSSVGIVIRETEPPLKYAPAQSRPTNVCHFKDKGKAKVDYVCSPEVQSSCKRSLTDVEPSHFRITDEGVLYFDPAAAPIDEDTLEHVLDAVACEPSMSFSPAFSQMECESAMISHHIDPHVDTGAARALTTFALSQGPRQRRRCNQESRIRTPTSPNPESRASSSAARVTSTSRVRTRTTRQFDACQSDHPTHTNIRTRGPPAQYRSFGSCTYRCTNCQAFFWLEERIVSRSMKTRPVYHSCCLGGRVKLYMHSQYPPYIKNLFSDRGFMDNIRAYNQMFAMTSLGATVDDPINNGRGPYVFKVSGQIYH